ncbi:hypothetical protein ATM97_30295 [Nocardia sp. MH4]|uniref:hypothetical protein n=1 Tax=unclassified Nocardia TaxID=2637762 RepID=UPI001C4FD015|nr:hypothetical protein [Nocardia sp. MH4]MBW0275697.1 hypothetical protein [Nocardia sp. MH4]
MTAADPQVAFQALQNIISEWRELGRITTTAGLKPAMQDALEGFTEQEYGFDTFRDFILAAEHAGCVQVRRLPNGHNLVGLPGETSEALDQVAAMARPAEPNSTAGTTSDASGNRQIKSDVWSVFVDWRSGLRRLWDREGQHAFMYPTIDGKPAWESSAERFVEIPAVGLDQQVAWMREWTNTLPEPARSELAKSLAPSAPKGEFRRELTRLGLNTQWRATLQHNVFEHLSSWAAQQSIPLTHLLDNRQPNAVSARLATASSPTPRQAISRGPVPIPEIARQGGDAERLRQRLHRAIDRMSLVELAALPIRAEHLLYDD